MTESAETSALKAPPDKDSASSPMRRSVDVVKRCLADAPKTLALLGVCGIIAQLIGGLLFIVYFWSIRFMPDVDLYTSLTLLIVAALAGTFLVLVIGFALINPGVIFSSFVKIEADNRVRQGLQAFTSKQIVFSALYWFILPFFICSGVVVGVVFYGVQNSLIWWLSGLLVIGCSGVVRGVKRDIKDALTFSGCLFYSLFFSVVTVVCYLY